MESNQGQDASNRPPRLCVFAFLLVILGACGGTEEESQSNVEPSAIQIPNDTVPAPVLEPTDADSISAANEVIANLYVGSPMEWAVANQELITSAVAAKDVAVCTDLDAQQDAVFNGPGDDGQRYVDAFGNVALEQPLITLVIREGSRFPEYLMDSCLSDAELPEAELANMATYFAFWDGVANGIPALTEEGLTVPTIDESEPNLVEEFLSVTGSEIGFYAERQDETLAALTTLDSDECTLLRILYNTTTPADEITIGRDAALALTESNPAIAANFEAQLEFHEQLYIRCQLATVSADEVAFITAVLDYWNGN